MPLISDIDRFAFVVGAPRCGTTSLSHILRNHPEVCFPLVKEPHFFALHDVRGLHDEALRDRVQDDYLDRFFPDCGALRVAADCSVTYLYTPEQLAPILELWPESRFVVAVRDPLRMLPSLHQRLFYIGDETIRRFEDAWKASEDRKAGRRIPKRCADPRWLRYDEAARFGTYVDRLFKTVGRDRCHVVVFDDLLADPVRVSRQVLDFLDLHQPISFEIPHERSGRDVRLAWLQRLLKRPPKPVFDLVAPSHHRVRTGAAEPDKSSNAATDTVMALRKRLLRWNRRPAVRRAIDSAVQEDIRRHYQGEIQLLSRLIGRDLSHWLQSSSTDSDAVESGEELDERLTG